MSSRTLLGQVTARLGALAVWLTGGRLIKSPRPTETTYSDPYDGSGMPWLQSESYFHDLAAFGSEESGCTSTPTMQPQSSELSPEDMQTHRLELFRKYGIRSVEDE